MIPVVISSCKKYSEVLHLTCSSIQKYFPQGRIYVVTDDKDFYHEHAVVFYQSDRGWIKNLQYLLSNIDSEHVIVTMDDLVLESNFTLKLELVEGKDSVRLYSTPAKSIVEGLCTFFGKPNVERNASLMFSYFNAGYLRHLLSQSHSPWDFEYLPIDGKVDSLKTNLKLINIVVKGKYLRSRLKKCLIVLNKDSTLSLPRMNMLEVLRYRVRILFHVLKLLHAAIFHNS